MILKLMTLALGGWNKLWVYLGGALGLVVAFLLYRASLIGKGKEKAREHMRKQIAKQVEKSEQIEGAIAGMSDDDIFEWMSKRAGR